MASRPLKPTSFRKRDLIEALRANPALLEAARTAYRRREEARRAVWDSTTALAGHVSIMSDPPDAEMIPFELYPYQRDVADLLDTGESVIVLKARQLGMSWLLGLYADRRAAYDGWRIGYWSLNEEAAKHELERRMLAMVDSLPESQRIGYRRALPITEFPGKGLIQIFAATQTGGTSYTFNAAVFDEFALHAFAEMNWEHVGPTLSAGGQAIVSSTSNPQMGPNGAFYDLWTASVGDRDDWEILDSGVWTMPALSPKALRPVFLPWDVRPGRDDAWLAEEKKRYPNVDGAAFSAWYPSTPEEAFTGREGLVYPEFDRAAHVVESDPVPWEQCQYRFAGYDLGGGDPTAFVFLGAYKLPGERMWRVHQYGEWYERRTVSIQDIPAIIGQWEGLDRIAADPREPSLAESMRRQGYPAGLADWRRGEGFGVVREWLTGQRFTIHKRCRNTIAEYAAYRWAERRDPHSRDSYATSTPVDHHADAMDATRYALMWAQTLLVPKASEPVRRPVRVAIR
jgi:hypothetical protein